MLISIVVATVSSGFGAELFQEMDAEPERYEIHEKHPTGIIKIRHEAGNIVDALARYNQLVEELVMRR